MGFKFNRNYDTIMSNRMMYILTVKAENIFNIPLEKAGDYGDI